MPKPIAELKGIYKSYGKFRALNGIDLEVFSKELLLVMGPSGSGKSTLLNILGLLDVPDKGKVFLFGKEAPKDDTSRALIRRKFIGFIFQDFGLINYMTARENIELPAVFAGVDVHDRVEEIAETLGIKHLLDKLPTQLSGGERQRVAIARALLLNPPIILADEPTGNLDSVTGRRVMDILRQEADEGKAVVVVTHNEEHKVYGDRIARIRDGRIVAIEER